MKRNPKQAGTNLFDCIPQQGPCLNSCSQCYYNHNFYLPIDRGHFPTLEEVRDGIVRINSGNDSNIERERVILSTKRYPKRFFNTSIPEFDFPDPVVFTANPNEEVGVWFPGYFECKSFINLMFVRLRTSSTNLPIVAQAAKQWGDAGVPVLLTFMRYYDEHVFAKQDKKQYVQRTHIKNSYWCPTASFMQYALKFVREFNSKIEMCGTFVSNFCKDCLNCEKYYYLAKKRLKNNEKV